MAVDFVYLARTDDNPHIKTIKLSKPNDEGFNNATCSWISYSNISDGSLGEFSAETLEIISKVEQGIGCTRIFVLQEYHTLKIIIFHHNHHHNYLLYHPPPTPNYISTAILPSSPAKYHYQSPLSLPQPKTQPFYHRYQQLPSSFTSITAHH